MIDQVLASAVDRGDVPARGRDRRGRRRRVLRGRHRQVHDGRPAAEGARRARLRCPGRIPTSDPPITDSFHAGPGWTWGYGLLLNSADAPGGRRAGTGARAGLFNTHFFVDRTTGVCASICTNSLPFAVAEEALKVYGEFEQTLHATLGDGAAPG